MFKLGQRSKAELHGVHPDLVSVVYGVTEICTQEFGVYDGLRTPAEQADILARGASTVAFSKHQVQADGWGHAVDLVPWIAGKYRWEWPPAYIIAAAMQEVSGRLNVPIRWGGVWDRRLDEIDIGAEALEDAVEDYSARQKAKLIAAGKKPRVFLDAPHFELRL